MTERIQELIKQSTTIEFGVDNGFDRVTFDKEKFAELIIRECVDRIKNADMTDLEGSDPDDVLWLVERQIVKHFGVEE